MFLISFGGMLVLSDVYNPQINSQDWVTERISLPKNEEERIKRRFEGLLFEIEEMAKRDHLSHSLIYKPGAFHPQ